MRSVNQNTIERLCAEPARPALSGPRLVFNADRDTIDRIATLVSLMHGEVIAFRAALFNQIIFSDMNWASPPNLNGVVFQNPNATRSPLFKVLERSRVDALYNYCEGLRLLADIVHPIKALKEEFLAKFKKLHELRHSLQHRVEVGANIDKNALKAPRRKTSWLDKGRHGALLIGHASDGFTIWSTRKGEWLELDTGPEAYASLYESYYSVLDCLTSKPE